MGKMTLQIVMDAGPTREGGSYRGGRVPLNDGPCSLGQSKRAQSLAGTAHCPNNTTYNKGRGKAGVANVDPEGWQVIVTHLCGAVCGLARAGRGG